MCIYAINQWTKKDTSTDKNAILTKLNEQKPKEIKEKESDDQTFNNPYDSVIDDFIEYLNNEIESSIQEQFDKIEDLNDCDATDMEIDMNNLKPECENDTLKIETKPEIPQPISLTLSILNVCVKHISSNNQTEKLIVLRTINEGVQILKDHESELLPFIHSMWGSLAERFHEKNLLVVSSSLQLVLTLAELSKDFIRQRVSKYVTCLVKCFS